MASDIAKIKRLIKSGKMNDAAIATECGCEHGLVRHLRVDMAVSPVRRWTHHKVTSDVEAAVKSGSLSDSEIAQQFGLSRTTVGNARKSLGLPPVGRTYVPGVNYRRVIAMREKHPNLSMREIAAAIGITYQRVQQILAKELRHKTV